ncbi:MAG: hypothetical protein L6R42_005106 [Xanthoria sp. 1 TBL-2021]|nr:MAG: hypothetical protein L6R42_005106 [Xanthoria sp. 1 TBL-2021]
MLTPRQCRRERGMGCWKAADCRIAFGLDKHQGLPLPGELLGWSNQSSTFAFSLGKLIFADTEEANIITTLRPHGLHPRVMHAPCQERLSSTEASTKLPPISFDQKSSAHFLQFQYVVASNPSFSPFLFPFTTCTVFIF